MDYSSFQCLHDLLKDGIVEYIRGNSSSPNNSGKNSSFIHNGNISTEIRLACALCYFEGGSYLNITMSHAIGVTDFYLSIWAVVDATNQCPLLNFKLYQNVRHNLVNSLPEAKLGSTIALDASMVC